MKPLERNEIDVDERPTVIGIWHVTRRDALFSRCSYLTPQLQWFLAKYIVIAISQCIVGIYVQRAILSTDIRINGGTGASLYEKLPVFMACIVAVRWTSKQSIDRQYCVL